MLRLKKIREERKMSQVKLCTLTGINPADIGAIESGTKPAFPGWRKRISEALGFTDVDWLFQEADENGAQPDARTGT